MDHRGLWILCLCLCGFSQAKVDLPPGFKVCKKGEPDPNGCFVDAANADFQVLKDGYAPLGIEPLQPLQGKHVKVQLGNQATGVFFTLELNDPYFTYKFNKFDNADIDMASGNIAVDLFFEEFRAFAKHNSSGRFLVANIQGNGNLTAVIHDAQVRVTAHFMDSERDGEVYWVVDTLGVKVKKHGKLMVDFEVIANKDVNASLLRAINDNWETVLVPVLPYLEEEISKVMKDHLNNIVGKFPRSQLYPDE